MMRYTAIISILMCMAYLVCDVLGDGHARGTWISCKELTCHFACSQAATVVTSMGTMCCSRCSFLFPPSTPGACPRPVPQTSLLPILSMVLCTSSPTLSSSPSQYSPRVDTAADTCNVCLRPFTTQPRRVSDQQHPMIMTAISRLLNLMYYQLSRSSLGASVLQPCTVHDVQHMKAPQTNARLHEEFC